ncbi:MAG: N-acetylmuramoyl-L-alanine amidase [Candidatus Sericytochromatia bacterium]
MRISYTRSVYWLILLCSLIAWLPVQAQSAKTQLLDMRLVGGNLVFESNAPLEPQLRQTGTQGEYLFQLYGAVTALKGIQSHLRSPLLESVSVSQTPKGVQVHLKVTSKDLDVLPSCEERFCTLQFLPKDGGRHLSQLRAIQVDVLTPQTTRVRLVATQAFEFQHYLLENPHRLVLDTRGTVVGQPGLARQLAEHPSLRGIRLAPTQNQQDIRIVLDLLGAFSYRTERRGDSLEIFLQRKVVTQPSAVPSLLPPAAKPGGLISPQGSRALVVIDAGHGGRDAGAVGFAKNQEKIVTLAVAQYLQRYLENDNIQAVMSRSDDREVLLQPRIDTANLRNADMFVSIHCNSMPPGNTRVRGIETYYSHPQSLPLANTLHKQLIDQLGATDRRVRHWPGLYIRHTRMPSVLMEIGFLSSPDEEALLANPAYQRQVAKAMRDGIYTYLVQQQRLKPGV